MEAATSRKRRTEVALTALAILVGAGLVLALTGGPATSQPATAGSQGKNAVAISDFKFVADTITVSAGTEITFTNADAANHTATADDGTFDTGTLAKDGQGTVTITEPGMYTYHCEFHAFMKGTVEVK